MEETEQSRQTMEIRLFKVRKVVEVPPPLDDLVFVNAVNWFPNSVLEFQDETIPVWQVSPYALKTAEGHLMENVYQGSKLWPRLEAQRQEYRGRVCWSHPAEVHIKDEQILPAYFRWRQKMMNCPYPVRYPNGYRGKSSLLGLLREIPVTERERRQDGMKYELLDYIMGRKKVYVPVYSAAVQATDAFPQLKRLAERGIKMQITDVDVPDDPAGTLVTPENFVKYLNDPTASFGHAWTLSGLLLGYDVEELCRR